MRDYYDILDVPQDATAADIRAAYRFHIKAFHPDKFDPDSEHGRNAQRRTEEIIEAYGLLSKPQSRAEYDRFRKYTGGERRSLNEATASLGKKGGAPRFPKFDFRILRNWRAFVLPRISVPVAALVLVCAAAWFWPRSPQHFPESASEVSSRQKTAGEKPAPAPETSAGDRQTAGKALAAEKFKKAEEAFHQRDLTVARTLVDEADAADPNQAATVNLRGEILLAQKDFDGAEAAFNQAARIDPKFREAQYNLAQIPFKKKDYTKARERFEALFASTPAPGGDKNQAAQVIKFKIYLTLLLEGKDSRAQKMMEQFQFTRDTPVHYYAQAAWEFKHYNPSKANDWLVSAQYSHSPALNLLFADSFYDLGWLQDAAAPPVVTSTDKTKAESSPSIEPSPVAAPGVAANKADEPTGLGAKPDQQKGIPSDSTFGITEAAATVVSESEVETMIVLRFGVAVRSNTLVDPTRAKIQVFFYDLVGNKEVVLTNSDVSHEWLTPRHDWKDSPLEVLSVKYRRQKRVPDLNSIDPKQERKYLGFIVRVYYDDQLQDERADPVKLRELFPPRTVGISKSSSPSPRPDRAPARRSDPSPLESSGDFVQQAMKLRDQALRKIEPQVFTPTTSRASMTRYPWKTNIVTTVFWIGEKLRGNIKKQSVWDTNWMQNYGGLDTPDASARRDYIPRSFIPRQNPFYCALPYNDVRGGKTEAEAALVIPWFRQAYTEPIRSVCKDRWLAIRKGNKTCFAQWEDTGPFRDDHFQYVFQNERPQPNANNGAGLDVSPAVRDYLGLTSTDVTDWQFIEVRDVPPGPWRTYGDNNHFVIAKRQSEQRVAQESSLKSDPSEEPGRADAARKFEISRQTHRAWELEQKKEYRAAAKLYQTSASSGDPYAQTYLAKLYLVGKGVDRDPSKAKALLEKAAAQDHEEAKIILEAHRRI